MRHSAGIGLAVAVGAVSIAAPILLSVRLAWRQSVVFEESRVTGYARDTLRRGDDIGNQMDDAYRQLSQSGFAPCSPQDVDIMRRIDVGSKYLQAVARISGNSLTCTSLGTSRPIPLGNATLTTATGFRNWLNVRIPLSGDRPIAVVSKNDVALLVNPQMSLDTDTEGSDIALALFFSSSDSSPRVIAGEGMIRPEWYRNVPRGSSVTFLNAGYVVSVVRAAHGDLAAVAAAPDVYISRQVRPFAELFIPIGVICGLVLAGALLYIGRVQMSMATALRTAARRREFFLEYQPIVDLQSQRWIGAEALVRWRRGGAIVRPDGFIPAAEESGVICAITVCVAEIVAADLPRFLAIDPDFCVSINLSAADLRTDKTVSVVSAVLRKAGASPNNLQVEATEGGLLQNEKAGEVSRALRELGIGVAIDDFGTGYSNLARVETLGPAAIKIDKSFVECIGTGSAMAQVVPHIIEMGRSLDLKLVAEGVEREEQAEYMRVRGVQCGQGWFFGRPMRAEQLCAMMVAQPAAEAVTAVNNARV